MMVSVRRVAPVLLLLIALPALAQPRQSSRPPKELHRVGDHWTAYNPPDPSTYPPNARTHTIKRGDTLWDLAQQYYGNAYLWPQLWESNTWITDAHWIYPGDVLLVEGEGAAQAAVGMETTTTTTTTATTASTASGVELGTSVATTGADQPLMTSTGITVAELRRETAPVPLGYETDVYCYGYIGVPDAPMPNRVAGFEDVEVRYQPGLTQTSGAAEGDLIFIQGGSNTGLVAGETYMAIWPGELIHHPRTGALIGQHYNFQGQIRILCTEGETSRAVISQSCREIQIGTRLIPMPQLPIPIARIPDLPQFCDPPSGRATGFIIDSQDWDLALADGNLVQINLGTDDQIAPGDFFVVTRDSPIAGQPRMVLGEIGILTTERKTSTGRILATRRTMQVGDMVELR